MPELITTIDLLRHGEPVGGRKYRGQTDDPLSEKGWQQMRDAVGEHRPWQHIVSSPLVRCQAFALELARKQSLPLSFDERFMEVQFGVWEGKTAAQLCADDPHVIERFKRDPLNQRPAGAEPLEFDGQLKYRPQLGLGEEADADYLDSAVSLIWRAIALWLGLLLLLTIAKWAGG